VHCYAYKLNLVLRQLSIFKILKYFFNPFWFIVLFFFKSTKRVHALDSVVKKRFPSVAPTRWNYNNCLIEMMVEHRLDVINLMESIVENSETLSSAKEYVEIIQSFDFNFFLNYFQ